MDRKDPTANLIALTFGSTADPDRFDKFLDAWDQWWDTRQQEASNAFSEVSGLFDDALDLSERLEPQDTENQDLIGTRSVSVASVILGENGTVLWKNDEAQKLLDEAGVEASALVNRQNSEPLPRSFVRRFGDGVDRRSCLVFEAPVADDIVATYPEAVSQMLLSRLDWTDGFAQELKEQLGLSSAELKIARGLLEGQTAQEISGQLNRSLPTVRSHIKSMIKKTSARRQTELVQLLTVLRQMSETTGPKTAPSAKILGVERRIIPVGTGVLEVCCYGAGHPVLYFTTSSPPHETEGVRRAFADAGLSVFAPARASFANSSGVRGDVNKALLGAQFGPLLEALPENLILAGHREGGILAAQAAVEMARRGRPARGLILISTGAPMNNISLMDSAPENERRSFQGAQYALPAVILGYKIAARLFQSGPSGQGQIIRRFHSNSTIDHALMDDPFFYELSREMLAYCFENPGQIARDVKLWGSDWSDALRGAAASCPVTFVHGTQHHFLPFSRVESISKQHESISIHPINGVAQLGLYQEPNQVAAAFRALLKSPVA